LKKEILKMVSLTDNEKEMLQRATIDNLKQGADYAAGSMIYRIQEIIGFDRPVSVEVVSKQSIRYGLRYTIDIKIDEGV
jgi:hypothetical protein